MPGGLALPRRRPHRHRRHDHDGLLADLEQIEAAQGSNKTIDPATLDLVSPVTAPCRVVAQMTNFASHVKDAGLNPDAIPLTFFRRRRARSAVRSTTSSARVTCASWTTRSRSAW